MEPQSLICSVAPASSQANMHTLAQRHTAHRDGTGFSLCGIEDEIETANA